MDWTMLWLALLPLAFMLPSCACCVNRCPTLCNAPTTQALVTITGISNDGTQCSVCDDYNATYIMPWGAFGCNRNMTVPGLCPNGGAGFISVILDRLPGFELRIRLDYLINQSGSGGGSPTVAWLLETGKTTPTTCADTYVMPLSGTWITEGIACIFDGVSTAEVIVE
jgi:hypothetical protein